MSKGGIIFQNFPSPSKAMKADWAPIILEPIEGSCERLVVGIAAVSDDKILIQPANSLARLRCLYGVRSGGVIEIVTLALSHMQDVFFERGRSAFELGGLFSGVHLGDIRKGEGQSLEELAGAWLSTLSSLHDSSATGQSVFAGHSASVAAVQGADPIGGQILRIVAKRDPDLGSYFDRRIIEGRMRRRSAKVQDPIIDFAGKRLIANFELVRSDRLTPSIDAIKRRMWDLKVDRDNRSDSRRLRHEMLVRTMVLDKSRADVVSEAMGDLEKQADQQSIRFETFNSPEKMADRVLEIEHV